MVRRLVLLAFALALLAAAPAAAQRTCIAPPGTAAIDQYCEVVPDAGGDRGSTDLRPPVAIPQETAEQLARSGGQGEALLRQLGQDPAKPRGAGRRPSGPADSSDPGPSAPSDNPLDAVSSALSSGPTVSSGFIVALLAVTLLVLSWGWIAYRRRTGG